MYAKNKPYRNKKILQAAKEIPCCVRCEKHNSGDVVAAHYCGIRQIGLGKGMGQKPSDSAVAYLCRECHEYFDQYEAHNGIERSEEFLYFIAVTQAWYLKNII